MVGDRRSDLMLTGGVGGEATRLGGPSSHRLRALLERGARKVRERKMMRNRTGRGVLRVPSKSHSPPTTRSRQVSRRPGGAQLTLAGPGPPRPSSGARARAAGGAERRLRGCNLPGEAG